MTLVPGTRLGPYEIVAPTGAGGMGEVYRARDTRLDRTVAVKVLPAPLASDAALRDRFEREARAISSLQHPHICSLFDVGDATHGERTIQFLVLEFLQGETLADRLSKTGALPPAEALSIAIDICDALAAAHRAGIVHRDLKPANVFLTRQSAGAKLPTAKLLDFGLAKAAAPVVAGGSASMLPTTPPAATVEGTILGTFQYMAPEQIEGLEADARTDIFAFGAVLFEMLTGRPAFEGSSRARLLGAILKDEPPPVSALQPHVPRALERIVATCLAKEPDDRWQSARDLLHELKWVATAGADRPAGPVKAPSPVRRWGAAAALVVAALAAGFAAASFNRAPERPEPIQFAISAPTGASFNTPFGGGTGVAQQAAISPDGRSIVFVALKDNQHRLWIRGLGVEEARPLAGTEGAAFPFWSPDSRHIGFFAGGMLKRASLAGGPPIPICEAPSGRGGSWNADNVIVFSGTTLGGLQRVSADGGTASPVTTLDDGYGESNHRFPWFLPDGRHFLYTAVVGTCCPPARPARVKVGALDSPDVAIVLQVESAAAYANGHLLFLRDGTLLAQPFDPAARALSGEPFPIVEAIVSESSRYGSFSVSDAGTLVYATGQSRAETQPTWVDRSGRILHTIGEAGRYMDVALSPDNARIATTRVTGVPDNLDIWMVDAATGHQNRLTTNPRTDAAPSWSPDGQRLAYMTIRNEGIHIAEKGIGATAEEELLASNSSRAGGSMAPLGRSPDGRHLLYARSVGEGGSMDVWVLELFGERKAWPLTQTPAEENHASFSHSGKWVVYQSNVGGRPEVWVKPFPPNTAEIQISREGGATPMWGPGDQEIYFVDQEGWMTAVPVTPDAAGGLQPGPPRRLFPATLIQGRAGRQYAVSRDGQRFLLNAATQQTAPIPFTVLVNWPQAVQR